MGLNQEWNWDAGFGSINVIPQLLEFLTKWHGDTPAIKTQKDGIIETVLYKQLVNDSKNVANLLASRGITKSHVIVISELCYEWVALFLGITASGNVVVPLDRDLDARSLAEKAARADAKVLIVDSREKKRRESLQELKALLPELELYISYEQLDGFEGLQGCLDQQSIEFHDVEIDPNQTAVLIFTSGTTGTSKMVMLSHINICANLLYCAEMVKNEFYPGSVEIPVLPPHHMFCITAGILLHLYFGKILVFGGGVKRFSNNVRTFSPATMILVPMVVEGLYKRIWAEATKSGKDKMMRRMIRISNMLRKIHIDLRRKLFKSVIASFGGKLDLIISGGAYLTPEVVTGFYEIGIPLANGYGITECSPVVSLNPIRKPKLGSVGTLMSNCEVRIIDDEICVKSDMVMKGYYKDGLSTDEAFSNGYFKTGDLGYFDNQGYLFITGRKKNLIILADGNNISPEELEVPLENLPLVKSVMVIDQLQAGNSVLVACIYPDYEYAKEHNVDDIKDALEVSLKEVNQSLPLYKRIKKIEIVKDDFPKTSLGKIKRHLYPFEASSTNEPDVPE